MPRDLVENPVTIRSGIGRAHDAVDAKSPEAQRFYDQGIAYLHSYVWIEAARSFNTALRADPKLAVAHAGLSVAYVELNQPDMARAALERARTLAAEATPHDRLHVDLRALQMAAEAEPGNRARLAAYRSKLDEAIAAFPDDAELRLLRGVAESADPADRGQGSVASSVPHYERALSLVPAYFAAHHYLSHALENTGKAPAALEHARAYAKQAPQVPHARHMVGHVLSGSGQLDTAIAEFEAADRLQREYFAREQVPASYDWHHHHNLDLLASAYQYVGRMRNAEATRRSAYELPSNLIAQLVNKRQWPSFLRSRDKFDQAVAAARTLAAHPHPLVQATGYIEEGLAQLDAGQLAAAVTASNRALGLLRAGPEGAGLAATPLLGLQGSVNLTVGASEKGRSVLADVARRLAAATGPDNRAEALFALEALARTARRAGDAGLAATLGRQAIDLDPQFAGGHYQLALAAEQSGDAAAARAAFAKAAALWSGADADLPELADARRRLR